MSLQPIFGWQYTASQNSKKAEQLALPIMLTTALLSLATAASALSIESRAPATFFHISDLTVQDSNYPQSGEAHYVNFTVSNPNAVYEQGGNMPSICLVEWTGCNPPTCLTPCFNPAYDSGDSPYYARVIPGPDKDAHNWILEVREYFTYKNSVLNEVIVPFKDGETAAYECPVSSSVRTVCNVQGLDAEFESSYGVAYPYGDEVCERPRNDFED